MSRIQASAALSRFPHQLVGGLANSQIKHRGSDKRRHQLHASTLAQLQSNQRSWSIFRRS